jgi:hypothetical protein
MTFFLKADRVKSSTNPSLIPQNQTYYRSKVILNFPRSESHLGSQGYKGLTLPWWAIRWAMNVCILSCNKGKFQYNKTQRHSKAKRARFAASYERHTTNCHTNDDVRGEASASVHDGNWRPEGGSPRVINSVVHSGRGARRERGESTLFHNFSTFHLHAPYVRHVPFARSTCKALLPEQSFSAHGHKDEFHGKEGCVRGHAGLEGRRSLRPEF